jgi:hypothetical protein
MRTAAMSVILLALVAGTSEAQGNRRNGRNQGIPPGQMPPAGMCRVWYDNLPPGRQPRATSCDQAERLASRDRNARVIYGPSTSSGPSRAWSRDGDDYYGSNNRDQRYRDRNYGGTNDGVYGNTYPNANGRYGYNSVPYDNGYRDGLEKGREDAGDRDSYDPVRHSWYRSGDRGYNSRYGSRETYKLTYRDGFEAGYEQAYRSARGYGAGSGTSRGLRIPW